MSMEIHCLSDRQLSSMAEWQHAIDAEGFALALSTARPIHSLEGFVPAQSGEMESGFECYHDDDSELLVAYASVDFGHPWRFALSFRWGGNLAACLAAYQAGAAYAKATGGVVFDPEQAKSWRRKRQSRRPGNWKRTCGRPSYRPAVSERGMSAPGAVTLRNALRSLTLPRKSAYSGN